MSIMVNWKLSPATKKELAEREKGFLYTNILSDVSWRNGMNHIIRVWRGKYCFQASFEMQSDYQEVRGASPLTFIFLVLQF